jgi:hypothetical protein
VPEGIQVGEELVKLLVRLPDVSPQLVDRGDRSNALTASFLIQDSLGRNEVGRP